MNSDIAPPTLEDLVRRVSALETARGSEDLADMISTVAERISALEKARASENLVERIAALESTQKLADRITVLETTHRTEGLAQKVRAAEDTHRTENVATRVTALEALHARVQGLEDAQQTFQTDLDELKTAALTDLQKLVYEHAARWLSMVNSTVWTLNSIFLVGSILALNGASQVPSIHWKHTAGYIVFGLCVVWFIADVTYTLSGWRTRYLLSAVENNSPLQNHRLYSWPANWVGWLETPYWLIWIVFQVATYVPVIGIAYLAYAYFIHVCLAVDGHVCEYPSRWAWWIW
jgi:hypothetical protein